MKISRTLLMAASAAIIVLLSQDTAAAGPRGTVEIRQPDGTYRSYTLSRRGSRAMARSVSLIRIFKAERCVVMRVSYPMPPATDTVPRIRPKDVWQFAVLEDSPKKEKEERL